MGRVPPITIALALCAPLAGCPRPPPDADDEVSDAVVALWLAFDGEDEDLTETLRTVEALVYESMDVDARSSLDRSLMVSALTEEDIAHLDHPGRGAAACLPVAVAAASSFPPGAHQHIQLLDDLTEVEPYSPDHYQRTFLEGEACWEDQGCTVLRTFNDLVRDNALMTMPYEMYKDFRWVDLAEAGDTPRWAFLARGWQTESFAGEGGKSHFYQSYVVETWVPRDGRGPLDSPDTEWTADSTGGGSQRLWVGWSETDPGLDIADDQVAGTTRLGMDKTFEAADDWLEAMGFTPDG